MLNSAETMLNSNVFFEIRSQNYDYICLFIFHLRHHSSEKDFQACSYQIGTVMQSIRYGLRKGLLSMRMEKIIGFINRPSRPICMQ